ncbi:MarR family transcriptional regulator [Longimicrobium terrae]|uniref:DNA-binding MarR family transcriptional regulator n=1 Tax=Longimicrobium terrae TaxID=1639882 RepID=A0A841H6W2_9BACT|nr:DNA-binding MarR family transcriptional regulator [Longimicrobium terrae]MBB6073837.1 DNA-binding MarR family transcriptional regulator [Longimicrobium terrae]
MSASGDRRPPGRSPEQEALTDLVMRTFRLNGLFLEVAEHMARPAGLTAARWQVLGAVLREPLTVSGAARAMGLTRQSVQRLADVLVADGMAEFIDNPRHRRARLLRPTAAGWDAIAVIRPLQHAWAAHVTRGMGEDDLRGAVEVMDRLAARLDDDPWRPA